MAVPNGAEFKCIIEVVNQGGLGKLKGTLQIGYKPCFIDVPHLNLYTKDGQKDDKGNLIDEDYLLIKILG